MANFLFEIDLKSRRNKARCELLMNVSAFELFERVARVKNYKYLTKRDCVDLFFNLSRNIASASLEIYLQ
jgi:hypothetical protein